MISNAKKKLFKEQLLRFLKSNFNDINDEPKS